MPEDVDILPIIDRLRIEFDALIEEREEIRVKTEAYEKRAEEIGRKINGIQKTLQGFSLYTLAQETPTALMKQTTTTLQEMMEGMTSIASRAPRIAGPDIPKTLSECCRDILRQKQAWVTAVQVRDALMAAGFDFSKYTSNPLSSIHTTLKRMVPDEVITETRPEGVFYRWAVVTVKG